MAFLIELIFLVFALVPSLGQQFLAGCGAALQDIPNPASDTCTSFYRCYNSRQYSLRCPLGQAFHFDRARCRPENEIDCPLQLQRFQAPSVPHYLRPPQAAQEREVEIRVVHVGAGVDPNNLQFFSNGRQVPVTRHDGAQRGSHTLIAAQQQQQQQAVQPINIQQSSILSRTPVTQVQAFPVQPPQASILQSQSVQGQTSVQGV